MLLVVLWCTKVQSLVTYSSDRVGAADAAVCNVDDHTDCWFDGRHMHASKLVSIVASCVADSGM